MEDSGHASMSRSRENEAARHTGSRWQRYVAFWNEQEAPDALALLRITFGLAFVANVVEQIGIDEGYLVLPDGDPPVEAARIQAAIRSQVRLSSSLGVASCKVVAKVASDMRKPGGITYVPAGEEAAFLAPLPVRTLPGVGPKSDERLAGAGCRRNCRPDGPPSTTRSANSAAASR